MNQTEQLYQQTILSIENKAKSMSFEQLDQLACGTGFLTLLEEPEFDEFNEYLQSLPDTQQELVTDIIMNKVYRIYCDKQPQDPEKLQHCKDAIISLLKALKMKYTVTKPNGQICFELFDEEIEVSTITQAVDVIKELIECLY